MCLYGFITFISVIIETIGCHAVKAQYLTIPGSNSFFEIVCGDNSIIVEQLLIYRCMVF